MADFKKAYKKLMELEIGSAENALTVLPTENNMTFMGIYRSAHPKWKGWQIVDEAVSKCGFKKAGAILCDDREINKMVESFYKKEFWDGIKGDAIENDDIARNIFIFAVNAGVNIAVKKAQRIIDVKTDGILGNITLKALNVYPPKEFVRKYKESLRVFYQSLAEKDASKMVFLKGWTKRVKVSQAYIDFLCYA